MSYEEFVSGMELELKSLVSDNLLVSVQKTGRERRFALEEPAKDFGVDGIRGSRTGECGGIESSGRHISRENVSKSYGNLPEKD